MKQGFRIILILLSALLAFNISAKQNKIKLGIDVLAESGFSQIKKKRIALLTNYSGRNSDGVLSAEVILKSRKCSLVKIFTPEHGFFSSVSAGKTVSNDTWNNIPLISLYGSNRRPMKFQMNDIDAVVVDIQDIGVRSYTYISTVYKVMDACAEYDVPIIILDRPNPLGGISCDGNITEPDYESFVSIVPIPYVHGLTIGEFAYLVNNEGYLSQGKNGKPMHCSLTVIKMENWRRNMLWEDTGLEWFQTSPNLPTIESVKGISVAGILGELGKFNTAVGTAYPFQFFTFATFNEKSFLSVFNQDVEGITFKSCYYNELKPKTNNGNPKGMKLFFSDDYIPKPYTTAIKILLAARKVNPAMFNRSEFQKNHIEMFCKVTGTSKIFDLLVSGGDDDEILNYASKGVDEFKIMRKRYFFYE